MRLGLVVVALAACDAGTSTGQSEQALTITCGSGTVLAGTQCVVAPPSCGAGTHVAMGTCVADGVAAYEIQIAQTMIGADARTKHQVIVVGTNADGTPATDDVVVTMDHVGGTLAQTALTLQPLGTTTDFVPCDQSVAGCTGPLRLTLALANAPLTPVAHVDVQIVAPFEVATIAPCSIGTNALYVDGNVGLSPGRTWATAGSFVAPEAGSPNSTANAALMIAPADPLLGSWQIDFNTGVAQTPLVPGIYTNASFSLNGASNSTALAFSVNGWGVKCNGPTGAFQIHDVAFDTGSSLAIPTKLIASFEAQCTNNTPAWLQGCVHYEAP
jgi:hypothetical protein